MKKSIILLLCALLLFCAGCGEVPVPLTNTNTETNEPAEELPVYLELHFGNGEVLRKEIDYMLVPEQSGGMDSSFYFASISHLGETGLFNPSMDTYFTSRYSTYTTAVFPDGQKYSMSGARSTEVDMDSRALIAYLWRDEPYQTEREYFEIGTLR